ncbi:sensor domain-containing diguanylate cyclase [Dyella solisilvae]|nr:sensor domain-containing diguanylate cyclase [Dyella solisilvae]
MTTDAPHPPSRERLLLWGGAALLFLVALTSNTVTLLLSRHAGSMASIWTINGLVAGTLVSVPRRYWPPLVTAGFAALLVGHYIAVGWLHGAGLLVTLLLVVANLVEILVVAFTISHYFPTISGETSGYLRFGRIAVGAAIVGCILSTLLAEVAQLMAPPGVFFGSAEEWFRAHLLGMVIVGMLMLVAFRERGRMLGVPGKRLRMLRDVLLLAIVSIGVFAQERYPMLFVVFAPLLYLVFRYRFTGLVLGIAIVALVTNVGTSLDEGPFNLIRSYSSWERTLIAQIYLGVLCLVAVPVALALADRQRLGRQVADSESRYRLLAEYSSDLIVRIGDDNSRRYVSPSVTEMLGWSPEEFAALRGELIHPDDRDKVLAVLAKLREGSGPIIARYRLRRRSGGYLWIEALGNRAPSPDHPGESEIIYTARDVTQRVLAEESLADSEKRLRTITDNVPAAIAHVDTSERYTFINAYISELISGESSPVIGHTVAEVRPAIYPVLKPHIDVALHGGCATFEYESPRDGHARYFQATYLPAVAADGSSTGLYMLTTDITRIKLAEQQLNFLAHHDALTGIANRLSFRESSELSVRQAATTQQPLLLMMIDVDFFKHINDTYGHAAGDVALSEVAKRLKANVRKSDLLARIGGDEFVVLCHDIEDVATAERLAQQITDAMRPPVSFEGADIKVSLSIGVALCRDVASMEALAQRADEALYQAKEAGRACFRMVADGF